MTKDEKVVEPSKDATTTEVPEKTELDIAIARMERFASNLDEHGKKKLIRLKAKRAKQLGLPVKKTPEDDVIAKRKEKFGTLPVHEKPVKELSEEEKKRQERRKKFGFAPDHDPEKQAAKKIRNKSRKRGRGRGRGRGRRRRY